MAKLNSAAMAAAGGLLAAAVARELRRPAAERTWNGRVAGVPYDLRRPTSRRLRQAMWNPDSAQVFVPTAFGVGWTVNLAALQRQFAGARR